MTDLLTAVPHAPSESYNSLTARVYEQLRREIVLGEVAPGERLAIEALGKRLGAGTTPVREALRRLSSEHFVSYEDQKGFRVAPVSRADLLELMWTRGHLNALALRESIARGDPAWEEGIVLAFHRLSRAGEPVDENGRSRPEYEHHHRAFHVSLSSACASRWLLKFCETLFDYSERYRNLIAPAAVNARDEMAEHREIMDVVLARRADDAVALLDAHISRTAADVLDSGKLDPE